MRENKNIFTVKKEDFDTSKEIIQKEIANYYNVLEIASIKNKTIKEALSDGYGNIATLLLLEIEAHKDLLAEYITLKKETQNLKYQKMFYIFESSGIFICKIAGLVKLISYFEGSEAAIRTALQRDGYYKGLWISQTKDFNPKTTPMKHSLVNTNQSNNEYIGTIKREEYLLKELDILNYIK